MNITVPENLVDDGAMLVHPAKAYILRHLSLPQTYADPAFWENRELKDHYISARTYGEILSGRDLAPVDVVEYIGRLHASVETLYGDMEFDLHNQRTYSSNGLRFHKDHEDVTMMDETAHLVRMATCIHNAGDRDRYLVFQRPDWSNHIEEFKILIPTGRILVIGGQLITDYDHGIPASADVETYRSVITRFSKWRYEEGD